MERFSALTSRFLDYQNNASEAPCFLERKRLDLKGVKAIVFDLDGTVADSLNRGHKPAWIEYCRQEGITLTPELLDLINQGARNDQIFPKLLGRELEAQELAGMAFKKEQVYLRTYLPEEISGLTDFLNKLKAKGIRLAVATSAPPEGRSFLMEKLGIMDQFEVVIGAEDTVEGKPAPDAYRIAAERLGIDPSECIAFEDTPFGVQSARNAGYKSVIGVASTFKKIEGVSFMINNFRQIRLVNSSRSLRRS